MRDYDILIAKFESGQPLLIKYDDETSILLAWTSVDLAMHELASMNLREKFAVVPLDIDTYRSVRDWHKNVGIKVLINLKNDNPK